MSEFYGIRKYGDRRLKDLSDEEIRMLKSEYRRKFKLMHENDKAEWQCELCGNSYVKSGKYQHIKSQKHQFNLLQKKYAELYGES